MKYKTFAYIFAFAIFASFVSLASGTVFADSAVAVPTSSSVSLNWAGYVSTGGTSGSISAGTYSGVRGTWNIPTPTLQTSGPLSTDATWVGIGGVTSSDLIQAGTQAIVEDGSITYEAWVETLPNAQQIIPLTVHGGDSVTVSLQEQTTNEWNLVFTNTTTGKEYTQTIPYVSSHSSAEWIEETPTGISQFMSRGMAGRVRAYMLPLDDFGSVQFSNASTVMNGTEMNIAATQANPLTLITPINGQGITLASPSTLSSDGRSFSITRSANAVVTANANAVMTAAPTNSIFGRMPSQRRMIVRRIFIRI